MAGTGAPSPARPAPRRAKLRDELVSSIAAVMLLSSVVTFVIVVGSFRAGFDRLVESNDSETAVAFARALAGYYDEHGSWDGVGEALEAMRAAGVLPRAEEAARPVVKDADGGRDDDERQDGDVERRGHGSDIPLILTDASGTVVYAWVKPSPDLDPAKLPWRFDARRGVAVEARGGTAGYVFWKSMIRPQYNAQEAAYLSSIARSAALSVGVALALALALGATLAARFARRISALDAAVRDIAEGRLGARVSLDRNDEIGSLAVNINGMADRLGAAESARQNLLADMAHELRTPVSIIQANLEMMLDGVYAADEARLRSLLDETLLLADLIADLRTLSDLETGAPRPEPAPMDMAVLLGQTCEKYRPLFERRGMTIRLDAPSPCEALADEDRMRQVARNILFNALKYAPDGSAVTVSCSRAERDGRGFAHVSVADEGPGVPEADVERIFERFYRVDASRSRDSGGRGLGLALCRQFVEASGGSIAARNREPHGLEVFFDIPSGDGPRAHS